MQSLSHGTTYSIVIVFTGIISSALNLIAILSLLMVVTCVTGVVIARTIVMLGHYFAFWEGCQSWAFGSGVCLHRRMLVYGLVYFCLV